MGADFTTRALEDTEIVRTTSAFDCGGRCPLRIHVRDGVIHRVEGDDAGEPEQLRACLRCRALRQYVHHPDRLKYPLRRSGAKGEGTFERISWDDALGIMAEKITAVRDTHGSKSIFLGNHFGYTGQLHNGSVAAAKLLAMTGGFSTYYGNISSEGAVWATLTHYGSVMVGHSREDLLNSKLIILWGWDPARMISGTNTMYHLIRAKEAGARIVCVDPRYTDSAATLADQWIPVRPGTDTAMMVAMAHVLMTEGLLDQAFLDRHTVGFDKFKDYVLGKEDGTEKTPAWAQHITGVDAETIAGLARDYAATKPAALMDCQGPARSAMGEQYNRCAMTLCAMTGNVGRNGGSAGGGLMGIPIGHMFFAPSIPGIKNPAEKGGPSLRGSLDLRLRLVKRIHVNKIWDAMLEGTNGGYPADIKLAWFFGNNFLNQLGNANKGARALQQLDFLIVNELFMTPTARYADLLLPVTSVAERNDLTRPWPSGPYFTAVNRAIEPMGECKSDFEIVCELAERMGIADFNPKSEEEWLRGFVEEHPENSQHIKDYDLFRRQGIHRVQLPEPIVAFKEQIEDPDNNPFPTPSGKIEIFSQRVADLGDPTCPPIPKYLPTPEDRNDPLSKKYPLQLLTPHPRNRVHSEMYKVDWLREIEPHRAWINPVDAEQRGIRDGDLIHVFNDRGRVVITAWLTERIIPGVISICEGAWYDPGPDGIDRGACANALTNDAYSSGGACLMNSSLVEAARAQEGA
jgi:DmsA/YnfE family anaerobic dimethyl sulfoxide reductase A subunit